MSTTTTNGSGEKDYSVIEYGDDYVANWRDLPEITVQRAIQRTLKHVLGNEVASAVGTAIEKINADRVKAGNPELDEDEVEAEKERLTKEERDEKWAAWLDGTWGQSQRGSSGPRVSAFETEYNRLLATIAKAILAGGVKSGALVYDKSAKTWTHYTMQDGARVPSTVRTVDSVVEEIKNSTRDDTVKKREAAEAEAHRIVEAKQRRAEIAKIETTGAEAFAV